MRDLGYMTYKAAERYQAFFAAQDIPCEIKDFAPFFYFLLGGGLGNNRRVNLLVPEEHYERAQKIFLEEEHKHVEKVKELTPAANRTMVILGLVSLTAVCLFYWWKYVR